MNRLNFILPDFTRIIWVSQKAKDIWENRIHRISYSFSQIEKFSVIQGKRIANLYSISCSNFLDEQMNIEQKYDNLFLLPLSKIKSRSFYSSTQELADSNDTTYDVRCVLIDVNFRKEFANAWQNNDNKVIGKLLGYPSCCIDFFEKYWVNQNFVDTTYPMSLSGTDGPKECNILLRWIGVRSVSHLPCSFNCEHTYNRAVENISFGRELGYNQEMDWLEEMLDWPVQWSALHGIAEIKIPILKISTRTDATSDIVIVNRTGFSYPEEGASGTKFPYINKSKKSITNTQSFSRSILLEKSWEDNGFKTAEGMIHSHNILLECLNKSNIKPKSVIDFGCGNAELLRRIKENHSCEVFGVEIDGFRFDRIKFNFPNRSSNFYNEDMFDADSNLRKNKYDLAIVMPGRFEENEAGATEFISWLKSNVEFVLFYGYGDWLSRLFGDSKQEPIKTLNRSNLKFNEIHKSESEYVISYIGSLSEKEKETKFNIL